MTPYTKYHVLDFCIEDEQLSNNDREISVFVDSLGMTNIEIGSSVTIRTDYSGVNDLRDALHNALCRLDMMRRCSDTNDIILKNLESKDDYECTDDLMNEMSERMNPVTPMAAAVSAPHIRAEKSEQQLVDPFNPVIKTDPLKR